MSPGNRPAVALTLSYMEGSPVPSHNLHHLGHTVTSQAPGFLQSCRFFFLIEDLLTPGMTPRSPASAGGHACLTTRLSPPVSSSRLSMVQLPVSDFKDLSLAAQNLAGLLCSASDSASFLHWTGSPKRIQHCPARGCFQIKLILARSASTPRSSESASQYPDLPPTPWRCSPSTGAWARPQR